MLPGFRFLFAAIMLSLSLLVFGLGAASLLRAAHQSFASNPTWRSAPEVPFAQRVDTAPATLATLSVEPPAMEKTPTPAPSAETEAASSPPAPHEQVAALKPADAPAIETPTPEAAQPSVPVMASPPVAVVAPPVATSDDTRVEALSTPPAQAASPTQSEPASSEMASSESATPPPAVPDQAKPATTGIATLGGPPVKIAEATPAPKEKPREKTVRRERAKADQDVTRRRHAKRTAHRRRLASRARLATQGLQQQQANPFAQPAPVSAMPR